MCEPLSFRPRPKRPLNGQPYPLDWNLSEYGSDEDPFEKYARGWLLEHRIELVVQPSDKPSPAPTEPHGDCYSVLLQRGERRASLQYWGSVVDAQLRQQPSILELLFALAWESRFSTIREAVEHGCSRKQARTLAGFSRTVRRVVPRLALERLRAVENLYDASGHGLVAALTVRPSHAVRL